MGEIEQMSKSIISNKEECLVCKTTYNLHRHHIFFGNPNRSKSEKYGCWCYLCARHHNMSNAGVHFNQNLNIQLKQLAQKKFEEHYPDLNFLKIFGKNYL